MREMKDSGVEWIGEIPSEWESCKLIYVLRGRITDGPHETPDLVAEGIPFISVDSLNSTDKIDFSNVKKFISEELYQEYAKKAVLEPGDILFTKAATIGKTAIVGHEKFMVWSPIAIIKCGESVCNKYIYYVLNSKELIIAVSLAGTHNTQINVGMRALEAARVPLPSLEEQKLIADCLDRKCAQVDNLIANVQAQIEKLKAYKQSVITEVVTKGLDPTVPMKDSGVEWIGEIPEHWGILKFKYIATVKSNLVEPSLYLDYPQVSPENIEKGSGRLLPCRTVEEAGVESNNHLFFEGQIIYSKVRPILNKVTIAPFDGLCSADMYPIETSINKKYLVYLMLSNIFLTQVKLVTENRVKMPKINQEEISRIIVCCPTSEEQEKITLLLDKKCTQIDQLIAIKQAKIEKLEQYKRSLIYEYVTGKKEVS